MSLKTININGVSYELGKSFSDFAADLGISPERMIELLSRDFYCPTLPGTPTFGTLTYTDTDGSVNTFQIGQPCRWLDGETYKMAVLLDVTDGMANWYYFLEDLASIPVVTTIRLDQTITDPATMITRTVDGGAIEAIRANSHRVLGKYTAEGTMTICQLDDTDSTKYTDGSAADLTGAEGDVYMRLPQFYYKAVEYATDIWDITFAYGGKPDDSYKEWDGTDLIGVYEAYVVSSKLYSRSGVASSGRISQADFKAYASARGTGFSLVKWKHQNIMAFLYYAMYGHMNCQAQIGAGVNSSNKTMGQTDSLGMEDTVAGGNGDGRSINFWGLENWWGNKAEWVDNVVVNNRVWSITEDDSSVRTISAYTLSGYISKVVVGEYLDVICVNAEGSETTGVCDYYTQTGLTSRVVLRSSNSSSTNGGVAYAYAGYDSSSTSSFYGSRLAFRGVLVEAESVSAYQSLTAIG